jgi:threonine/homoserine/homoserine lactone efflux protein
VYGALALTAAQATGWFARHPAAARLTARACGALLLLTATLSVWQAVH